MINLNLVRTMLLSYSFFAAQPSWRRQKFRANYRKMAWYTKAKQSNMVKYGQAWWNMVRMTEWFKIAEIDLNIHWHFNVHDEAGYSSRLAYWSYSSSSTWSCHMCHVIPAFAERFSKAADAGKRDFTCCGMRLEHIYIYINMYIHISFNFQHSYQCVFKRHPKIPADIPLRYLHPSSRASISASQDRGSSTVDDAWLDLAGRLGSWAAAVFLLV